MSAGLTEVPFTWVCCPDCQLEGRVGPGENNTWGIRTVESRLLRPDKKEIRCAHPECGFSEIFHV